MRHRAHVTAALAACILVLGGCGSSSEGQGERGTRGGGGTDEPVSLAQGVPGLEEVELSVAQEEGGIPTLSWEPVSGASFYRVVVTGPDDRVHWSWEGDAEHVEVGTGTRVDGSLLESGGAAATVSAWGEDGAIALSPRTPL